MNNRRAGDITHGGRVRWLNSYLHECSADPCPVKSAPVSPETKRRVDEVLARAYAAAAEA